MRIEPFRMERMQSRYENYVEYNLSESGVHPMRARDLLTPAGETERFLATELGYAQSNGTEELRDRIARLYPGARRENVLVTNGGSEANYAVFWSLLEKGDRVACMLPNYLQTWGLSRAYGGGADPFHLREAGGPRGRRWALDLDGLRRAVRRGTRVILITHPNNPTGAILDEEEIDEVVRVARRAGAWIVADEIYRGAELSGRLAPTFWGRYDRLLITSGLSKAFGLPGLRIGWVVGPPRAVERIWSYRDYTTIAPGMLSDHLARLALEPARHAAILERTRGIIRRNLPVVEEWLRGHDGVFSFIPPEAGAIVLARYDLPIAARALAEKLRVEHSVLIVPGDQFGAGRHIRIGFGSEAGYLRAGLQRIDECLRALRTPAARDRKTSARGAATRGAAGRGAAGRGIAARRSVSRTAPR